MPYNIYDDRGNKIGQVTSAGEEAAGAALMIVFLIYALPYILAIGLAILAFSGLTQVYWPWAKTAHHLTPYANLNGVITCLAIPLMAFLISARWEKVAKGEVGIVGEFGRIAAIVYAVIAVVSIIPVLSNDLYVSGPETSAAIIGKWFLIAPIAVSTLTFLRFKPIRIIVGILVGIPLAIISLGFVILMIWAIVNAIGGWLFH